jgi:hypothetical protein
MTRLGRELLKFFRSKVLESDCFVYASIIPLAVLVIETLYPRLVSSCKSNVLVRMNENLWACPTWR